MAEVFISWASPDKAAVDELAERLEVSGIKYWISSRDMRPGEDPRDRVQKEIQDAKVAAFLLSDTAADREWIIRELDWCVFAKKIVLPAAGPLCQPADEIAIRLSPALVSFDACSYPLKLSILAALEKKRRKGVFDSMRHPLEAVIPVEQRRRAIVALTVVTGILGAVLANIGRSLPTDRAKQGILSFELAGDPIIASASLKSWDAARRAAAQTSLSIDYAFLLCYSTTLALACVAASSLFRRSFLTTVGLYLAWGSWLAGLFDALENYALLRILQGATLNAVPEDFAVSMARVCALAKFGLIFAALTYIAAAGFYDAFGDRFPLARNR